SMSSSHAGATHFGLLALSFFFAGDFFVLRFELCRLAMKRLAAPGTVDGSRLVQRIAEIPSTGALGLERIVTAGDAVAVVGIIRAKAAAHGAAFGD
ncbi:MAG: hypothetical protein ACREPM_11240, partial [Gemmatimonadaceae bacterium]